MADGVAIEVGGALALYDAMCTAIAECVRVDEAKDIRDKAVALEAYYKQARNLDAEREAANVRLRAERRVGELLKSLARAEPRTANLMRGDQAPNVAPTDAREPSPYAVALDAHGMSRQTASRFQALADVPSETFERALRAPEKPTTAGVLKHREARAEVRAASSPPKPRVSDAGLMIWGHLRDFETEGYFNADRAALLHGMTDAMRADVRRLIPQVIDFLSALEGAHEPA